VTFGEAYVNASLVERIKREMQEEGARGGAPEGFPRLPRIPAGRYVDPEFFELERSALWGRSWLLAAHTDEFPEPGCFRLWDKLDAPILIVRGRDDVYRAFYNACQHRGAPLVREAEGQVRRFVCRYHAWTYELDGALVGVPDEADFIDLDKGCHGLVSLRCERFGGWIFVNQDAEAPGLRDSLGPIPDEMAQFEPDALRCIDRHSVELACNWKTAQDAFLEVYHLQFIHKQSVNSLLDHRQTTLGLFENGHSRMVTAKRPESVMPSFGGPGVLPIPSISEIPRIANLSYHAFPNLVTPTDVTGFPFLQFWPKGVGKTEMEISWYVGDWGGGEVPEFWKAFVGIFDVVLGEDTENLAWIHQSMDSPGFSGVELNYQERRIYHFHEQIDRVIGADRIPEALRVEPRMQAFIEARG
jgi:phenylpropionate dioxygenase-like ring-hydroxylating dioxygenase large terminal subunit